MGPLMSETAHNKIGNHHYPLIAVILLMALGLTTNTAAAKTGIVGTWDLPQKDRQFTVEYLDDNHIRLQIEPDLYLLINQQGTFAVIGDSVLDVDAFSRQAQQWSIIQVLASYAENRADKVPPSKQLYPTRKKELVANIQGDVYIARVADDDGSQSQVVKIVLSNDPRLLKLKLAMQRLAKKNVASFGHAGFGKLLDTMQNSFSEETAILRYDNKFQVMQLAEIDLTENHFALPENAKIKTSPNLADLTAFAKVVTPLAMD